MLQYRFIVLIVLMTLALPGIVWSTVPMAGNGLSAEQQRTLPPFDHIVVQGSFDLSVAVNGGSRCSLTGDANLLDLVAMQVSEGELLIAPKQPLQLKQPLAIHLETAKLVGVTAEGAHRIAIEQLMCPVFSLIADGACSVRLAGFASLLDAELSGVSTLEAQELECCEAAITANGTTVAKLQVRKTLGVHGSGLAEVLYLGTPELEGMDLTGRARVAPLD